MSVSVDYRSTATIRETLETNVPGAAAAKKLVTHDLFNSSLTLPSASNPTIPATKGVAFELALIAAAVTLDLTAVPATGGGTFSCSGLKVQLLKIKNKSTNANPILIEVGASNGYELAGADFSVLLAPGQEFTFLGYEGTPDVGGAAKTLDLSGTGTQAVEIVLVAG